MDRMKGQAFIISETMLDILKNFLTIAFFIGLFLLFTTYNITVKSSIEKRKAFDLMNSLLGDKCIIYEDEGGNFYRAIFDKDKLDKGDICLDLGNFGVEISDFDNIWRFGKTQYSENFSIPITVFDGQKFKFGKMVVGY